MEASWRASAALPYSARLSPWRRHELSIYFVACYALTWPLQLMLIRNGARYDLYAGPSLLLPLTAAACGPSLAAFAITALNSGRRGALRLLAQARSWHAHPCWYVIALVLPYLILLAGVALFSKAGGEAPQHWFQLPPLRPALAALVPPLGEEFGWRAFALPKLQRRTGALCASLLIGAAWGAWHLPLFFLPGGIAPADFPFFFAQVVAASVVMTWLYNSTGGRLCVTLAAHLMLNLVFVDYPPIAASGLRPIACAALVAGAVAGLVVLGGGRSLTGFSGLSGLRGLVPASIAPRASLHPVPSRRAQEVA